MPPSKKTLPPMQSQALPVRRCLLKLGVSISGVLSAVCPATLANPPESPLKPADKRPSLKALLPESSTQRYEVDSVPPPLLISPSADLESRADFATDVQEGAVGELEKGSNVQKAQFPKAQFPKAQPPKARLEPAQSVLPAKEPVAEKRVAEKSVLGAQSPTYPQSVEAKEDLPKSLNQICHSIQKCEQSITLNIDAAGATIGDVFEVAPNVRVEALPKSQDNLAQLLRGEDEEELEESEENDNENLDNVLSGEEIGIPTEAQDTREDDDLGIIRANPIRSDVDLGILRLLQTATVKPEPPKAPFAFLIGRVGFLSSDNTFRSNGFNPSDFGFTGFDGSQLNRRDSAQIYQAGLSLYLFPRLTENTNLYAIAETNLARYEGDNLVSLNRAGDTIRRTPDYNELEFQLGIRHRLKPRTYVQVGWRNQTLYKFGYEDKFFSAHYLDALISHRSILSSRIWLDSIYQMRYGFASPKTSSRVRHTLSLSLNYGFSKDLRTSLLYQTDLDDYTQRSRFDIYQQVLGIISYGITPEARLSVFGGTRFGHSSEPSVNLDDTFYGAGLNVNLPLF